MNVVFADSVESVALPSMMLATSCQGFVDEVDEIELRLPHLVFGSSFQNPLHRRACHRKVSSANSLCRASQGQFESRRLGGVYIYHESCAEQLHNN